MTKPSPSPEAISAMFAKGARYCGLCDGYTVDGTDCTRKVCNRRSETKRLDEAMKPGRERVMKALDDVRATFYAGEEQRPLLARLYGFAAAESMEPEEEYDVLLEALARAAIEALGWRP